MVRLGERTYIVIDPDLYLRALQQGENIIATYVRESAPKYHGRQAKLGIRSGKNTINSRGNYSIIAYLDCFECRRGRHP